MENLKALVTFLILNAAFLISANAQIVYTNVNPDSTITGTYLLDLNNDGINDYYINKGGSPSCNKQGIIHRFIYMNTYNSNVVAQTNGIPAAINLGAIVNDGNYVWNNNINQLLRSYSQSTFGYPSCYPIGHATYSGNWTGNYDNYLGLKFNVGVNTYYCWARLSISAKASSCTIKDYAYNSTPNQPILAGETTCANPTVTLSASGSLSFCNGDSVTLTANGTGYVYQWKKNGVNIAGATNQNYLATTAGKYKCRVINSCGSKTSKADTVTVPCRNADASFLSMTNGEELEHLSVYPNPATNSVTIKFPSDDEGQIQIINLFGRIVETHNYASLQDETLQIDVSKYPSGIYVVRWNSGENNETKTFSVIK